MNTYTITFEAESPIRSATIRAARLKYPDAACEHSHVLAYDNLGNQCASFDLDRVLLVQITAISG